MGRILVVDDEESLALLIKKVLEMEGYEVLVAPNGQKALEILQREPVDLVITDYMMPVMDGLELVRRIKRDEKFSNLKNVKIIMLTVSDFQDTIEEALKMGVEDYITKPFDFSEIIIAVNNALG